MTLGPAPWRQRNWDWRAACNFVFGGAGAGLVVFAAPAAGPLRAPLLLAGLVSIGFGLTCVWFELGRPLRAFNVFRNPRTSWMSREAYVALALVPAALGASTGLTGVSWLAAALALAFVYCQGRMLGAARGIPAWRERLTPALIVTTGLVEGGGWFTFATALFGEPDRRLGALLLVLIAARALLWWQWRARLDRAGAAAVVKAFDAAPLLQGAGSVLPFFVLLVAISATLQPAATATLLALGAVFAAVAGTRFKFILLGAASYNQGFTVPHVPVRGARY